MQKGCLSTRSTGFPVAVTSLYDLYGSTSSCLGLGIYSKMHFERMPICLHAMKYLSLSLGLMLTCQKVNSCDLPSEISSQLPLFCTPSLRRPSNFAERCCIGGLWFDRHAFTDKDSHVFAVQRDLGCLEVPLPSLCMSCCQDC